MYSVVLPSLLRLIRGLEYSDLHEIDGLLECPAVVPHPNVFADFGSQTPEVQVVAMDSLFHLINWLREIVNCFARLIKQPVGKKVSMCQLLIAAAHVTCAAKKWGFLIDDSIIGAGTIANDNLAAKYGRQVSSSNDKSRLLSSKIAFS